MPETQGKRKLPLVGEVAGVGFAEVLAGFVDGALGVVVGLDGEAVLVDGAIALAGDVEDFAEGDVAPDLGPGGIVVAAEGVAVGVDGGLVVALGERGLRRCGSWRARLWDWP